MKTESQLKLLLAQIDFSPDNVVGAASAQARIFVTAIDFHMECLRLRNAAKMLWERERAEGELRIRETALQNGTKTTERFIEGLVITDPSIAEFAKKYTESEEMYEYSRLLLEAFRMRRDALRICSDTSRNEMGLGRAVDDMPPLAETRKKLKSKFPG